MEYDVEFVKSYRYMHEFLEDDENRIKALSKLTGKSIDEIKIAVKKYKVINRIFKETFNRDMSEYEIANMILKAIDEPMTVYVVAEGVCSHIDVYRVKIHKCG